MTQPDEPQPNEPEQAAVTAASLMAQAEARSELADWGNRSFVDSLDLLLDSCRATAALTSFGWMVVPKVLLRHLRNRLYVQSFLGAHPDVGSDEIVGPVVITGLPRTGTTLLHNLMALDPANRFLRLWEALHPVPADEAQGRSEAVLVEQAQAWLDQLYTMVPTFPSIHAATPRGPEECDALLQNTFASQHFSDMFRVEAYSAWLDTAPLIEEYRDFALQLRVLGRSGASDRPQGTDTRWVLKSPSHLGHLDALLTVFPDCLVVQCHRDPYEAIGSYASLVAAVRQPYCHPVPASDAGSHALARCSAAAARALDVRDANHSDRFADVAYRDLTEAPLETVAALYERMGRQIDPPVRAAMADWLVENHQHRHGVHQYSLEQFGLSTNQVDASLAPYLHRFAAETQSRS